MAMLNELRHAARSLTRAWGLALTVMLTLALGIVLAANAVLAAVAPAARAARVDVVEALRSQ